jgi:hypothetical protein
MEMPRKKMLWFLIAAGAILFLRVEKKGFMNPGLVNRFHEPPEGCHLLAPFCL